jgi:hypothetical protein
LDLSSDLVLMQMFSHVVNVCCDLCSRFEKNHSIFPVSIQSRPILMRMLHSTPGLCSLNSWPHNVAYLYRYNNVWQ